MAMVEITKPRTITTIRPLHLEVGMGGLLEAMSSSQMGTYPILLLEDNTDEIETEVKPSKCP